MYKLPEGIRIPNNIEYPENFDVEEIHRKRKSANIVEGYTISNIKENKFNFYAEISTIVWYLMKYRIGLILFMM